MLAMTLDDTPPAAASRRARLLAVLTAPAPTLLVVVLVAVAVLLVRLPDPRPTAPVEHLVRVGVSAYPAKVTALWRDAIGVSHTLDPYADQVVRVPARAVIVAVATAGVQCSVTVDGVTQDTQVTADGVTICSWVR